MGCYICTKCDRLIDGDWNPGVEDVDTKFGLMCSDCADELEDDEDE